MNSDILEPPDDDGTTFADNDDPLDDSPYGIDRPYGVRFGEGQPINRSGRPKGSPNRATIIRRVAKKRHRVRIDGKVRSLSTLDLVLRAIRTRAAGGDIAAFDLVESLRTRLSDPGIANRKAAIFYCGSPLSAEEWQAVHGLPRVSDEEVLARFPHLKHVVQRRGGPPDAQ